MKTCTKCKILKEINCFAIKRATHDGHRTICKSCHNAYQNAFKSQNRDLFRNKQKAYDLFREFKLTQKDYDKMLLHQNNKCAICFNAETTVHKKTNKVRDLSVDHCHKTGKVRGLLCGKCNQAIGLLKESPHLLYSAISYLSKQEEKCAV